MRILIFIFFTFPIVVSAQFTFAKTLDLATAAGRTYDNNEVAVLDKLKTLYGQGYMLDSYEMVTQAGARSDTFALTDLNGDVITERITWSFGWTTFQNRQVPLVIVTATTDNLDQYLQWMVDINQAAEYPRVRYEPYMSVYSLDDRRRRVGLIVSVPYTPLVNNPPHRIRRKTIANAYTLVVSFMEKPIARNP